jgi:two-component system cell cycle sensor histidine kinase PleC
MISDCNRKMSAIVEDLLLLSSFDLGRATIKEEEGPLDALLSDAVDMCHLRSTEQRVNVNVSCPSELSFSGDQKKMRSALAKLVDNAIKFSPKGGECHVVAGMRASGDVRVRVSDEGAGMDTANMSLALKPYKQGSGGLNRSHEGLGLGLPLAHYVLTLHGATLDIKSSIGAGAIVDVILPTDRVAA